MQIAKIVPKVNTREAVFDYAIPPDILVQIKIGLLVRVPFNNREVEGIVVDIKRHSKVDHLRSITKIIDPHPVIDSNHIELAQWMSNYYLSPLSKTLFLFVVPSAIRAIKNEVSESKPTQKARTKKREQEILLMGDFNRRMKFYDQAIKLTLKNDQSVIILIPDLSLIKYFYQFNPIVLHAGLSKTERWRSWNRIRQSKQCVVLGSQSALFAPIKNLGLVIIDQEENDTYKNERSPRYDAVSVAKMLIKLTHGTVILGSLTPRLESLYLAQRKKMILKKIAAPSSKEILIFDLNTFPSLFNPALEEEIAGTLKKKKKIVIYLDRKGEGRNFTCHDCGWIQLCPNCGLPLTPMLNQGHCFRCEKVYSLPTICPRCASAHLKVRGLSTGSLRKKLDNLFPKTKIVNLENSFLNNSHDTSWEIAIVTSFALKYKFPPVDLCIIFNADERLSIPDFRILEDSFQRIYKFLRLGRRAIIQTHLPNHPFISALARQDYYAFYNAELELRQKYQLPPFSKLIRLINRNRIEESGKKEAMRIFALFEKNLKDDHSIRISPASPLYSYKKNNYYYFQIIIRLLKERPRRFDDLVKNLPSGWIIDVDPRSLL